VKLELHPDALIDLREAAAWYETQRRGLADAFLARVETALARALAAPLAFPKHPADERLRRVLVARFPYAVVFDTVYVAAFAHGRRWAGYWKPRIGRQPSPQGT
jgi:toxin ParE1/3/4